jgi:hypoxanthine phosphoribosyltransferase
LATSSTQITSEFRNPNLDTLLTQQQIQDRIKELGAEITRDYAGLNPLLIGVLKGACFFLSDLLRAIDTRLSIEFMAISSYGSSTRTSGEVRIMKDLDVPIEGRHRPDALVPACKPRVARSGECEARGAARQI